VDSRRRFARAVDFLIARDDLAGPVNFASPNPLPNREFMAILRETWDVRTACQSLRRSSQSAHSSCAQKQSWS